MSKNQRMSQWSIGDAYVQMSWPEPLSAEDLEDVEAFIASVMKGIKRRARGANPSGLKPDAEAERETPVDSASPSQLQGSEDITKLMASLKDPRTCPSIDDELEMFANLIEDAKSVHGDLYEGDAP